MITKKYFAIGAAAVLILLALMAIVGLKGDEQKQPLADNKTLTRESAAKMIKAYIQTNPFNNKLDYFTYDNQSAHYYIVDPSDEGMIKKLEAANLVKIMPKKEEGNSWPPPLFILYFDFTEQAEPYIINQDENNLPFPNIAVLLGEVENVEVSGISFSTADFTAKYKPTLIGKIIDEKRASEEQKGKMSFTLYDDGWRIGQPIN